MSPKERRKRAHALAYVMLQRGIDAGFVYSEKRDDETDADLDAMSKLIDGWAQTHFTKSDANG